MFSQPLNDDPKFLALIERFPIGTRFTAIKASVILGATTKKTGEALKDLAYILSECPEGTQLQIRTSGGGGHKFIRGE